MEKLFRLKERGTDVRTEILAGITTFMTMAYILAVNPNILSASGMDSTAVLIATCLASCVGSVLMGCMANLPFALSAGMGPNAFFAYTVCIGMGFSWKMALFAVFVEGLIFILLSVTNVREAIFDSIPLSLKRAESVGLGLFIAFIGLQNSGVVVSSSTIVELRDFRSDFSTGGICALLAVVGVIITAVLYYKKIKGAVFFGIVGTWALGIVCQLTGLYVPDNETYFSVLPSFGVTDFTALSKTFGECFHIDFDEVSVFDFIVVVVSFLFVDIFDTLGTLTGVATKADMLDEKGKFPAIKPALLSDAIATSAGAILGTSTTTTFVESAAGIGVGGRTGLTAIVAGILFLISTFMAPLFISIPSFATAPALVFVGFLMFTSVIKLDLGEDADLTDIIPAFLCMIGMPLFYSISDGIAIGIISYVLLKLLCGKKEKLNPILCVIAVLFLLKYMFL